MNENTPGQDNIPAMTVDQPEEDRAWLKMAQDAYQASTDYMDTSLRKQWDRNISHFLNEFPNDSKYSDSRYKGRSKIFRPKTRANIRANEAAFARALFSTTDLLDIQPWNDTDEANVLGAEVAKYAMDFRLQRTIPWFMTAMGAYQDACVYGVAASYQYWKYEEITVPIAEVDLTAEMMEGEEAVAAEFEQQVLTETRVVKDQPCIDLIPPENIRFDPGADWRDPVNTSPYLIRMVPMYIDDVLTRMDQNDAKTGAPPWRRYTVEQIRSTRKEEYDSTRRAREGDERANALDQELSNEYEVVWAHENFIRIGGEDFVFWTLGTDLILSEPVPMSTVYLHGVRPVVLGCVVLEAHRNHPSGLAQLMDSQQEATNDLQNQRFDNVQLVLNKRYFLRRGQQVDLQALMRNVPGGGVMMTDPDRDVRIVETPDITGSSYNEQDRLDLQMDEISGNFSQGTVMNSRSLNETVGGMEMMNSGATAVQELNIRTFIETWVEPVLNQLLLLEQAYETDETILALAGRNSGAFARFGEGTDVADKLLRTGLFARVSVGMGATNPQQKLNRLLTAVTAVNQNVPGAVEAQKPHQLIQEVFGIMGYRDGSRFYKSEEQLAEDAAQQQPQIPPEIQIQQQQLELSAQQTQVKMQIAQLEQQTRLQMQQNELMVRQQIDAMKLALDKDLKLEELYRKLGMDQMKEQNKMAVEAAKIRAQQQKIQTQRDVTALVETNRMNEMRLRRETGAGI